MTCSLLKKEIYVVGKIIFCNFASALVCNGCHTPLRLKGNQVRGLNRPATVSSIELFGHVYCVTDRKNGWEGRPKREQVRRPAMRLIISIISWIRF